MLKIRLDASHWTSVDDFYDALLPALKAPVEHGRDINAIIDSIIGGGMNGIEPPYVIVVSGAASLSSAVLDYLETAKFYLAKARAETCAAWDRDVDATIEIVR